MQFYTHKTTVEAVRNVMTTNRTGEEIPKQKSVKENWLIRGINLVDIETQITEVYSEDGECGEFRIIGTKEENFDGVVINPTLDPDNDDVKWFKITVNVEHPQDNGSIKIVKENWLVKSENIESAQSVLLQEKYLDMPFEYYVSKSSEESYVGILNWDIHEELIS